MADDRHPRSCQRRERPPQVALDCAIMPLPIGATLFGIGVYRGSSVEDAARSTREEVGQSWSSGMLFWGPVNLLRFRFVPLEWRAPIGSLAAAVWGVYLSAVANKVAARPAHPLFSSARSPRPNHFLTQHAGTRRRVCSCGDRPAAPARGAQEAQSRGDEDCHGGLLNGAAALCCTDISSLIMSCEL